MPDEPGYVVVRCDDGTRVGSHESNTLPHAGDLLMLKVPDRADRDCWRVVRREFINSDWYVVVESASASGFAAYEEAGGAG